jgi:hypothetical protein
MRGSKIHENGVFNLERGLQRRRLNKASATWGAILLPVSQSTAARSNDLFKYCPILADNKLNDWTCVASLHMPGQPTGFRYAGEYAMNTPIFLHARTAV